MAKFCGKCGSKLNEQGKCPNCKTEESKLFSLNTVKQKPWIGIVAIVLVLAIVVGTISIISVCFRKDDPTADDLQLPIVGKFTDKKIIDGQSAIQAVQKIAEDLGLENAADELTVKREDTVGELTYYRLQQNYKGIPLYGSDFIVITDENGEAKGVTGNTHDIDESISLTPTVTQEQVEASIQAYFGAEAKISVPKLSDDMLVVHNYGHIDNAELAYDIYVVASEKTYRILIGAQSNSIYKCLFLEYNDEIKEVKNDSKNLYVYDGDGKPFIIMAAFYDDNGSEYAIFELNDDENTGTVIDVSGKKYDLIIDDPNDSYLILDADYIVTSGKQSNLKFHHYLATGYDYHKLTDLAKSSDKKATELLNLAEEVYDFYYQILGRKGFDNHNGKVNLVYDCRYKYSEHGVISILTYGDNAYSRTWLGETTLHFGDEATISDDLVAHEYTHSIESVISSMEYAGESGAIMEAYSDIFGELFEDWNHKDTASTEADKILDNDCDWEHGDRKAKNPSSEKDVNGYTYPDTYLGKDWLSTANPNDQNDHGRVHTNCTVLFHAAYLMTQTNSSGTVLTIEQLAHLWYNTLFTLPSNCTFNALRQNMLMVAESMDYTNEQIACITAAFDAVGIDGMDGGSTAWEIYSNKDLTMQVYGINMELYDDYTIDIIKYGDDRSENKHIVVTDTNPVPLQVSAGNNYTITIRDRKDTTKIVTKNIRIVDDDDADQTIQFATIFGNIGSVEIPDASTSDERDIVLVLDNSGSMSGTPIEETRKASENFVKTVLQQDASIGVVAFESEANMLSNFSMDEAQLMSALGNLYASGGTNTLAGLAMAGEMLEQSNAKNKIIVLMSDGRPSNTQSELSECAKELRQKGVIIYALGFFDKVADEDKSSAQSIMETIADDGRHYEVEDVNNLVFFFGDIADQISGQQYIFIKIACPVEVTVEYDGEVLCSEVDNLSTRTSFGSLTFEERTDGERVKVLRLKQGTEYDIRIEGTGEGRMNYTIGLMDENGEYSDMRKFYNVKITDKTVINTVASESRSTVLEVDEDGDGKLDIQYKAGENSRGEIVKTTHAVWIIPSVMLMLIAVVTLIVLIKKNVFIKKG